MYQNSRQTNRAPLRHVREDCLISTVKVHIDFLSGSSNNAIMANANKSAGKICAKFQADGAAERPTVIATSARHSDLLDARHRHFGRLDVRRCPRAREMNGFSAPEFILVPQSPVERRRQQVFISLIIRVSNESLCFFVRRMAKERNARNARNGEDGEDIVARRRWANDRYWNFTLSQQKNL